MDGKEAPPVNKLKNPIVQIWRRDAQMGKGVGAEGRRRTKKNKFDNQIDRHTAT
jgi:hypothetical protein